MYYKRLIKPTVCAGLALTMILTTVGGMDSVRSTSVTTETELAGMSFVLGQFAETKTEVPEPSDPEAIVALSDGTQVASPTAIAATATPAPTAAPVKETKEVKKETKKKESKYKNLGISIASEYVNVRKQPNTESKVLGKLYRGAAARIVARKGDWVQIKSGKVTGYIKKEYLAIGFSAEKLEDNFGTKLATVSTQTLKVREEKSTDCTILTLVPEGEVLEVVREDKEWVKVMVDDTTRGFVSKEFVNINCEFKKAISIKEEQAKIRRQKKAAAAEARAAEELRQRQAAEAAARQQAQATKKPSSSSNSSSSKKPSSSSNSSSSSGKVAGSGNGAVIAAFALNFVGNPYVYGGTSLTNGTDCSGFTQSVFSRFGISLPRVSGSQAGVGKSISVSSAKAGDLIFYASGGSINHVALCIGNGRIVHASTPRTGIKTSNMYYRTPYCARRVVE